MQRNAKTHYPILLVHGLFGFERIASVHLFHDVRQALRSAGARVFVPHLSATHSNEVRGEQLLAQIQRVLEGTGADKVNLIGHSQGALAARYAAATAPGKVASVTSVSGPNHGSELADLLRKALTPGHLPEIVAETIATLFADFLSLLSGKRRMPQNAVAALNALTTRRRGRIQPEVPARVAANLGWQGPRTGQRRALLLLEWHPAGKALDEGLDAVDPFHGLLRALSTLFHHRALAERWPGRPLQLPSGHRHPLGLSAGPSGHPSPDGRSKRKARRPDRSLCAARRAPEKSRALTQPAVQRTGNGTLRRNSPLNPVGSALYRTLNGVVFPWPKPLPVTSLLPAKPSATN